MATLNVWMLILCMSYRNDGLLLHSDDDLITAYQTLALQVQAMKTEMATNATSMQAQMASMEKNATSMHAEMASMTTKMASMAKNATSMQAEMASMTTKIASMATNATSMHSKMASMSSKISSLESTIQKLQTAQGSSSNGANYVRWGRTTCPTNGTTLVYEGYAAGSNYAAYGGAANYLCLPTDPQWYSYEESVSSGGQIFGAEYQTSGYHTTSGPMYLGNVNDEDAPCAVCSTQRSEVLMIPARRNCHPGWTKEYSGYLMAGDNADASATEYVCVDKQVEVLAGGHPDQNGRLFYLVEGICGSLKCPPYVNGRELACVVCSK